MGTQLVVMILCASTGISLEFYPNRRENNIILANNSPLFKGRQPPMYVLLQHLLGLNMLYTIGFHFFNKLHWFHMQVKMIFCCVAL